MAYDDLRAWIAALEAAGELRRIRAEVDPVLEITEISDRISKRGGPALLFENPRGSAVPVLINSFGSERRMNLALEAESLDEVAGRICQYLDFKSPEGLFEKLKMLPKIAEIGAFFPRTVSRGACQEVIEKDRFSLLDFPILQCWPEDGGRFITLPMVFSKNPETGKRNAGCYRLQVYDERTTGMHWQKHKQGAEHFRRLQQIRDRSGLEQSRDRSGPRSLRPAGGSGSGGAADRMEVAVAIGSDPAVMFSAILPLPPDLDEMLFAGFLRRRPVEMVRCQTVDLEVPANSEIVLEGYVPLDEFRAEGPFGDHTGYYSLPDDYPVFHLTCVTQRERPIYAATIVGRPPMEDYWMGHAIERIFLPLVRMQLPEVVDMHMPAEGVFHNLMIVAIRKSYPGHARKVMSSIWGLGQAMLTKCVVVVDEDVNVHDLSEVAWKALNHIDPERDIQFTLGPVDSLDHASRLPDYGSKMGVDATRKWPGEGFARPWPSEIRMSAEVKARVDALWPQLGL
jgi:4-hydroxy-3-polyprenylbenzoate decarboxylase